MSTSSPVLRSANFGCAGRTLSHASIASPTAGSTGLVNAVRGLVRRHVQQTHAGSSPSRVGSGVASGSRRRAAGGSHRRAARRTATAARPRGRARADTTAPVPAGLPCRGRSVRGEVQPGPHQLGPHLVGDHARVGADQRPDRPRQRERAARVEPPLDPLPLLQVAEERPQRPDQMRLGARRQRPAVPGAHVVRVQRLGQLADPQPVDRRDPPGGELPIPRAGSVRSGCSRYSQRPALISA